MGLPPPSPDDTGIGGETVELDVAPDRHEGDLCVHLPPRRLHEEPAGGVSEVQADQPVDAARVVDLPPVGGQEIETETGAGEQMNSSGREKGHAQTAVQRRRLDLDPLSDHVRDQIRIARAAELQLDDLREREIDLRAAPRAVVRLSGVPVRSVHAGATRPDRYRYEEPRQRPSQVYKEPPEDMDAPGAAPVRPGEARRPILSVRALGDPPAVQVRHEPRLPLEEVDDGGRREVFADVARAGRRL